MTALLAALAPVLLGVLALRALGLRWRDDPLGAAAWSVVLGALVLGAAVQIALELRLPHAHWWMLPIPPAVAGWFLGRRADPAPAARSTVGVGFGAFVALGVLLCLAFAAAGMDRPCIEGDEGNIWSLKAKSLLVDWPAGFAAAQVHNLHPDYPQLNPLLQAWVYSLTGVPEFVQFENRWPVQLCDVALFVAVAAALRRRLAAPAAAALAALVLFEPEFHALLRTAYADGMVALGLVVAVDGFLRWRDTGDRRHGWLAGFGLAFALWSKNEAMLHLACAGVAAVIVRARGSRPRDLVLLLPAVVVIANNAIWNRRHGLASDLFGANPTGKSMFALMAEQWPDRVPVLLQEALALLVAPGHAHVVFALLAAAAVLVPRALAGRAHALPALALGGAFVGLHVVYVGSFLPLRFHLDTSYTRVLFQLLPAAVVVLGACFAEVVAARRGVQTPAAP